MTQVYAPYEFFTNADGTAIDAGKVYIGENGLDAETNPITVYWDADRTTPAEQPIRTSGGLPVRSGTPSKLFVADDYSITLRDKNDVLVFSELNVGETEVYEVEYLSQLSDIAALETPPNRVYIDSVSGELPANGGGMFVYDATSNAVADGYRVISSPNYVGRFLRPEGDAFRASEHGIINHATLDQSDKVQDFLVQCINERRTALFDLETVDCNGADIWINKDGLPTSTQAGSVLTMRGHTRRHTTLQNLYMSCGKEYHDDGSSVEYSINTGASSNFFLENMTLKGAFRFINIEGSMHLSDVNFFAETGNSSFYQNVPDTWGQNMAEIGSVPKVAYTDIDYLVEFLYSNHIRMENCHVQNGLNAINSASNYIGGALFSGCSNPTIDGGRSSRNANGYIFMDHPIHGGADCTNVYLKSHIEENEGIGLDLVDVRYGRFYPQGKPYNGGVWDDDTALVHVRSTGNIREIEIGGQLQGKDRGIGIQIDGGDGVKVAGHLKNFRQGLVIGSGVTKLQPISATIENCVDNYVVSTEAKPLLNPVGGSNFSEIATTRHIHSTKQVFKGVSVGAHQASLLAGTGVVTDGEEFRINRGRLLGRTGTTGAVGMAGNGLMYAEGRNWAAVDGEYSAEIIADISTSAVACFIGMTDQNSALQLPCSIGASDAITAGTESDFVGFMFDPNSDSDLVTCVSRKNDGTIQSIVTDLTFAGSTGVRVYRVALNSDGDAEFFVDGVSYGTITDAVGVNDPLCVNVAGYATTLTSREILIHSTAVEQLRVSP